VQIVLCPNKQCSSEHFMCLDLVLDSCLIFSLFFFFWPQNKIKSLHLLNVLISQGAMYLFLFLITESMKPAYNRTDTMFRKRKKHTTICLGACTLCKHQQIKGTAAVGIGPIGSSVKGAETFVSFNAIDIKLQLISNLRISHCVCVSVCLCLRLIRSMSIAKHKIRLTVRVLASPVQTLSKKKQLKQKTKTKT